MALKAIPQFEFGGVDSRSNPLNMPASRSLRMRNFVPQSDGHLELRWGYSTVSMSTVSNAVIHSMTGFQLLDQTKYVVFFQGLAPKSLAVATGTVANGVIRGTAIASSSRWSYYFANNKLHAFNGTDLKFFDGTTWRDVGLRALTAGEAAAITVIVGAAGTPGVAATSVGGSQPGYQFYASIYNRVSGHVGNRTLIGARVAPGVASNINITGLPNFAGVDTEWDILIGRTGDGAQVPYAVMDTSGNWIYVANGATSTTITQADIDGNAELPTRNGIPPAFDKVARCGDHILGNQPNSATIYKSGSEDDMTTGGFVGRWEQSFAPDDIETFPTGDSLSCLQSYSGDGWCFSRTDMAILANQAGVWGWQGSWNTGCAGQEAFCQGWKGLPFWVTGEKQLATMAADGPTPISDEYEAALLSRIGDQYLSKVETRYHRDPSKRIDIIVIKALDVNGVPFRVVHDFNLRGASASLLMPSVASPYGQGYDDAYAGVLSTDYTIARVRDSNSKLKLWAGASTGQIYELHSGANDAGAEYLADSLFLLNAGPDRPSIPYLEWYGDTGLQIDVGQHLDDDLNGMESLTDKKQIVPGGDHDSQYRVPLSHPECKYVFVRLRLQSHSVDGNLALNDPPHSPLETYGRIYMVSPLLEPGGARGH